MAVAAKGCYSSFGREETTAMVIVDSREPLELKEWVPRMFQAHNIEAAVQALDGGDFALLLPELNVGVSRKTLGDFVSSLYGGNLETDLAKMEPLYGQRIL